MSWTVGWCLGAGLVAGVLLTNTALLLIVLVSLLVIQPSSPALRDHAGHLAKLPYPFFRLHCKLMRLARMFTWLKPAPLRVAEVAVAYTHSQALFVLVNLGVAETLRQGPKTAQQLAEAAGPDTNAEWLARVLKLAAELGLISRTRRPGLKPTGSQPQQQQQLDTSPIELQATSRSSDVAQRHDQDSHPNRTPAQKEREAFSCGYSCNDLYSANAATAVLCREHPNCMADFVKLFEDHFAGFVLFSEGIKANIVPFLLWSGGRDFWEHVRASPRHAATFDGAMRACNHTGAKMCVEQYPWQRYDVVVDVGGGNGQFLVELLNKHSRLQGVLVDQQEQVQRGREWWADRFHHLLPRMDFVAGNMFDAASLPAPEPGRKTLYVLKQILHDWSDSDSLAILRAIRAVISDEDVAAGRASLAVLETGVMESSNRDILQHRLEADMTMLMSFGDGKERDEEQMRVLLEAAGFSSGRLMPSTGLMSIIEAAPVLGKSKQQ